MRGCVIAEDMFYDMCSSFLLSVQRAGGRGGPGGHWHPQFLALIFKLFSFNLSFKKIPSISNGNHRGMNIVIQLHLKYGFCKNQNCPHIPDFSRYFNTILTRRTDYAPHINFYPAGFSDLPTALTLGALMSQYFFSANMPCFQLRLTLIFTVFLMNLQIIESFQEIPFCPKELVFNPRGVSTRIQLQNKEKCKLCIMILV